YKVYTAQVSRDLGFNIQNVSGVSQYAGMIAVDEIYARDTSVVLSSGSLPRLIDTVDFYAALKSFVITPQMFYADADLADDDTIADTISGGSGTYNAFVGRI